MQLFAAMYPDCEIRVTRHAFERAHECRVPREYVIPGLKQSLSIKPLVDYSQKRYSNDSREIHYFVNQHVMYTVRASRNDDTGGMIVIVLTISPRWQNYVNPRGSNSYDNRNRTNWDRRRASFQRSRMDRKKRNR